MDRPNDRTFPARRVFALALVAGAAACAGYPVQELSDARQTLRAAEAAGAVAVAPDRMAAARDDLQRAEERIRARDYRGARRDAEAAHESAAEALAATQRAAAPR
jgi:hypothetical protein